MMSAHVHKVLSRNLIMRVSGVMMAMLLLLSGARAASSEPLPPEQAFQPGAVTWDGRELMVSWQVQPGYYLYRDQFQVELLAAEGFELGDMQLPRGEIKEDVNFGTIEAMHDFVPLSVPLSRSGMADTLRVKLVWRGCSGDLGLCYPPQVHYTRPACRQRTSARR
ncbi:MAG: protein-disulfide reductase DsbD N-terminal domain-containing protein [Thiolinea sp.]